MAVVIERQARDTLTAMEMDRGDELRFALRTGEVRSMVLEDCSARVLLTNCTDTRHERVNGGTMLQLDCRVRIDGQPMQMRRYVCAQESFYEPYVVNGMRIWFDAVAAMFYLVEEAHGPCKPEQHARFAVQDATLDICPEEVQLWCPMDRDFIDIRDCYNGDDCWLGPYRGASAHGGLDINHPAGTPLFAPIDLGDQYYYNSVAAGYVNNRWRGVRRWPDGTIWTLQVAHIMELTAPEHTPLKAGQQFAKGAGVWVGDHDHSHFIFQVTGQGTECRLDPWILFWQAFEHRKARRGDLRARMRPLSPVETGEIVTFSPEGSRPGPDGGDLSYFWTFGDGGATDEAEPEHVFGVDGVYPVTLTVEDGIGRAAFTQHITVSEGPVLIATPSVVSHGELSFERRPEWATDTYGVPPAVAPRTLSFVARPPHEEIAASVHVVGVAGSDTLDVSIRGGGDWLRWWSEAEVHRHTLYFELDATGLAPGRYTATIRAASPGCLNSPQVFRVELTVSDTEPATEAVICVGDPGFYATPYFWLAPPFHNWPKGYGDRYLTNGGRPDEGEFCRFTPDLVPGTYEVSLVDKTPFEHIAGFRREPPARFQVWVHHAEGSDTVWVEPLKSRRIGVFRFDERSAGYNEGYVEIRSRGSTGQVLVDAIRFTKVD